MDRASRAATNGGVSPPPVAGLEEIDRSAGRSGTAAIMSQPRSDTTKMVSAVDDRGAGGSSTEATMAPSRSESTELVSAVDAFQLRGTGGSSKEATMAPPPSESAKIVSAVKEISGTFQLQDADEGGMGCRVPPYSVPVRVVGKGTAAASYDEHPTPKRRCKVEDAGSAVALQKPRRRKEIKTCEDQGCSDSAKKGLVVVDQSVTRGCTSINRSRQDLNSDCLMAILGWLDPDKLLRMATASRLLQEVICSPDFRCCYRENHIGKMRGFFVKTKGRNREHYPYFRCAGHPTPLLRASEVIQELWSAEDTSPSSYWRCSEILDSRDGKLLIQAGDSNRDPDMFVFYPHARANRHHRISLSQLIHKFRIATAALIPDDRTHQYKVIFLGRMGVPDYKMKEDIQPDDALVASFSSSASRWVKASTLQFAMPAKKMLRMGSVLIDEMIYFLRSGKQVISVDIHSLKLGTIELPGHGDDQKFRSRMAHVLYRGPGNQLCLSAVGASGMSISMYTYIGSSLIWEHTRDWATPTPRSMEDKAVRLVGSAETEGLLLLKIGSQDIYSIETRTGLVKWIASCGSDEEVLAYAQECPPVSQMLRA